MTALGYWVGGLSVLGCLIAYAIIRLHEASAWQRSTAAHARADREHNAQVIEFRSHRYNNGTDYSTGWGDDAHLQ